MKKRTIFTVVVLIVFAIFAVLFLTGKQAAFANIRLFSKDTNAARSLKTIGLGPILSSQSSDYAVAYTVEPGDSLAKIAKKFGTTIPLIKKRNALQSDVVRAGQRLNIWTGKFHILVSKAKNVLQLKVEDNIMKVYTVSTGKAETTTPAGNYTIITKLVNPVWYHDGKVYPPGHPENGLGSRWMGLNAEGYGIHGTIHPDQIGQAVSMGCVRMFNQDAEELYDLIPEGTEVSVVDK
ncbi:MAG: hypothetical protein A2Z88_09525 [Omnitrophica WOR_2 bacterium GWA2_47_8]|nr:MAG: hypothetical protein A2Z88_09525 [Omnitrophica WOR_2 bacterium GWA2_47_8]